MARSEEGAIELLDEVGNAEGCPLLQVPDFQVHFKLSDEGGFVFEEFGDATEDWILKDLYPKLDEARQVIAEEQDATDTSSFTPEQQTRIRQAVDHERNRVRPTPAMGPESVLGKDLKRDLDMPTTVVNKTVRKGLRQRLRRFKPEGKRH